MYHSLSNYKHITFMRAYFVFGNPAIIAESRKLRVLHYLEQENKNHVGLQFMLDPEGSCHWKWPLWPHKVMCDCCWVGLCLNQLVPNSESTAVWQFMGCVRAQPPETPILNSCCLFGTFHFFWILKYICRSPTQLDTHTFRSVDSMLSTLEPRALTQRQHHKDCSQLVRLKWPPLRSTNDMFTWIPSQ